MSNLLILGSEGFIGKQIKKNIKKNSNHKIYGLDIKGRESKNHFKCNIKNFDIYNFINKYKINIIIDLIGCTNHHLITKNEIKESLNKNFRDKKNIIKCLNKLNRKVKLITIGSLYKFGLQRKIKVKNFIPTNKSDDLQLIFKNKFENKLFQIKNNNIMTLVINIGSVYGNMKLSKKKRINLIDQIILKIRKKRKNIIYISKKKRFKNCIYINDAANVIISMMQKIKTRYMEVNITKDLVDFNRFAINLKKKFLNIQIKYNEKINLYYYIENHTKKYDLFKNFLIKNVHSKN